MLPQLVEHHLRLKCWLPWVTSICQTTAWTQEASSLPNLIFCIIYCFPSSTICTHHSSCFWCNIIEKLSRGGWRKWIVCSGAVHSNLTGIKSDEACFIQCLVLLEMDKQTNCKKFLRFKYNKDFVSIILIFNSNNRFWLQSIFQQHSSSNYVIKTQNTYIYIYTYIDI